MPTTQNNEEQAQVIETHKSYQETAARERDEEQRRMYPKFYAEAERRRSQAQN
jgi:hypothetical protein